MLHDIETVVINWTHQIREVLKKDSAQPLLAGLNPTPYVEIEFWNAKAQNLNCIYDQVILLPRLFLCDDCSVTVWPNCTCYAQNPLHTFPRNFPVEWEVANLFVTSRCNGIWETTRHNRHNGLLPAPTCYGLDTRKLV